MKDPEYPLANGDQEGRIRLVGGHGGGLRWVEGSDSHCGEEERETTRRMGPQAGQRTNEEGLDAKREAVIHRRPQGG